MARIDGNNGNDTLRGTGDGDVIHGKGGSDTILGKAGADRIYGGDGNDYLYGDGGNDVLYGGNGNDRLSGGAGHDRLYAGQGRDTLFSDGGYDDLFGGKGDDTFRFTQAALTDTSNQYVARIHDFEQGDIISLAGMDSNPGRAGDQAFRLKGYDSDGGFHGAGDDAQGVSFRFVTINQEKFTLIDIHTAGPDNQANYAQIILDGYHFVGTDDFIL